DWILPVIRKGGSHRGEVLGVYTDRTLPRVQIGRLLWMVFDDAIGKHQIRNRPVALIGFRFELIDLLIDFQLPSREIAVCPDDFRPYLVGIGSLHHASGSDGARNDEGIHLLSLVLFDGYDRINNLAGRIDADIVANGRRSRLLYDVGKSEDLRDRL